MASDGTVSSNNVVIGGQYYFSFTSKGDYYWNEFNPSNNTRKAYGWVVYGSNSVGWVNFRKVITLEYFLSVMGVKNY